MNPVERSKVLTVEIYRSRWSEVDFARLARLLRDHTGETKISVVSADGEDRFWTDDPDFFQSLEFPAAVRSVSLNGDKGGVDYEVTVAAPDPHHWALADPATAKVSGTSPVATSLFRDLEREFK